MKRNGKQSRYKTLAVLLLLLVFSSIAGCAKTEGNKEVSVDTQTAAKRAEERIGKPVVTVLMDLPVELDYVTNEFSKTFSGMPGYETDFWVQFESIPARGQERDTAITRLRTEVMAGKGPDLFLCAQRLYGVSAGPDDTPFFQFPVQAMENHLFLPLDDYIDQAEYMDWDTLQPAVMAAGRSEEGQQIMPLAYTFEVTFFDKETYAPEHDFPMTWEEMLEDPDPNIRYAASSGGSRLQDIIGTLADYSKDVPAFSEEELRTWAGMQFDAWNALPENLKEEERPLTIPLSPYELRNFDINLNGNQEYTILSAYNRDGGITANITAFAAVNRNARQPDIAFKLIDHLLKPEVQMTSPLVQNRMEGMPVYVNTGDENTPRACLWQMNPANFQAVSALREQINTAKFPGPLDVCLWYVKAYDPKVLEKSAHEQYVLMNMYLAES